MLVELVWLVIVLLIIEFVWRFVSRMWTARESAEPADDADVVAELRPRPTLNSGAVALEEPDDELDSDSDIYRDAVRHSPPNNVDGDSRCET